MGLQEADIGGGTLREKFDAHIGGIGLLRGIETRAQTRPLVGLRRDQGLYETRAQNREIR